jgi:GNAT superfamily N-acetyltransferase
VGARATSCSAKEEFVSRPHVSVQPVTSELQPEFTRLWAAARVEAGSTPDAALRAATEGRIADALSREGVFAHLATVGNEVVGFVVLTTSPLSGLIDIPSVCVDQLYVVPESRRSGVAHALLSRAAGLAETLGCEHLATCVPAQARELNRFFARLGFSSYVVRRVTSTSALRRRLAREEPRAGLDQVLSRRRSLRARATRGATHLIGG